MEVDNASPGSPGGLPATMDRGRDLAEFLAQGERSNARSGQARNRWLTGRGADPLFERDSNLVARIAGVSGHTLRDGTWCGIHVGRAQRHQRRFRAPARADRRSAFPGLRRRSARWGTGREGRHGGSGEYAVSPRCAGRRAFAHRILARERRCIHGLPAAALKSGAGRS